jgi:PAS domain S-box-containing protein
MDRIDELQAELARLRRENAMLYSANGIILRWLPDGTITFVNDYGLNFFGYDEKEIMGKSVNLLVPEVESGGRDLSDLTRDIAGHPENYVSFVNENLRKDGGRAWVNWTNKAVTDETGVLLEILAIGVDISGEKNAERMLRQSEERLKILNENLENLVVQRTQQVRNLSKELMIAEQRERQRLSAELHEGLQQTLLGAKMLLDTVDCASEDDKEEAARDIREVGSSIQKAIATTKALAVELNPPVLKNEGLDAGLRWLARHVQDRYGLVISVDISGALSVVRGVDCALMVQLARELLQNVVKHAQTKEVALSGVRAAETVSVSVEDHGVGFDVEPVRKGARGLEKMGLFSIEERLRLFGGSLDIRSRAGEGTRVTITIPLTMTESKTQ